MFGCLNDGALIGVMDDCTINGCSDTGLFDGTLLGATVGSTDGALLGLIVGPTDGT